MTFRGWVWLPLALALLLASACGGGSERKAASPTTSPEGMPAKEEEVVLTPSTAEEKLLASMLPTAQELGEAFPGRAWTALGATVGLMSEDERAAVELETSVAAAYTSNDQDGPPEDVSVGLSLYNDADAASAGLEDILGRPGPEVEVDMFDVGDAGDEAQGFVTRQPGGYVYTLAVLRVGSVLAFINLPLGDTYGEREEEVRALVGMLAEKMEAALPG